MDKLEIVTTLEKKIQENIKKYMKQQNCYPIFV